MKPELTPPNRYPVNGAFFTYSARFIDPSWGFAMGWNYAMSWLVVFPFELIAASITIRFWTGNDNDNTASVSDGVWIAVFLVIIIFVNVFGIRGYGEVEFVLGTIKVIAVIGFILTGIIINCGGVPTDTRYVSPKNPPTQLGSQSPELTYIKQRIHWRGILACTPASLQERLQGLLLRLRHRRLRFRWN
jgi:amino acid permease